MNPKYIHEMTRVLSGEASSEEREQFYAVLDADPDKKQAFAMMEKEWIAASDAMLYKSLDVESAWERHKKEYLDLAANRGKSFVPSLWKWAAVVIVAAGLVFYFFNERMNSGEGLASYSTSAHETLPITLQDGSTITLNENSSIDYDFSGGARKVNFNGEGFFEVSSDAQRPFIIELREAYIKVIGTAFNVKSEGNSVGVLVEEGVVEFGLKDGSEKVLIEAGSSAKLLGNHLSKMDFHEPNATSWYTKKLVFNQTPLSSVFSDITKTYHVGFQYDVNSLEHCRLTADFNNEELPDILETLHTIFKVDFKKGENAYIVTGKGCVEK